MLRIINVCFLVLSLTGLTNSYASDLTEESVRNVILKIDNAINTLNEQAIANTLSNDIEIIINISLKGANQVLKPSKKEYMLLVQQARKEFPDYKHSRSNMVIEIKGDQAFVSSDIQESLTIQGQNISSKSKEETIIKLVNGVPLIIKITGYTNM